MRGGRVAGCAGLRGSGDFWRKVPLSPPGSSPSGLEAAGGVEGGEMLVAGAGATTVQLVIGEEGHVGMNFMLQFS